MDRSTCWALEPAAQAPLSPRRQPTKREACIIRGDLAWVHAMNSTPGYVFGATGTEPSQFRAVLEFGFIFGNNMTEK